MCVVASVDDIEVKTVGGLRRAIGNRHVIALEVYLEEGKKMSNLYCLCAVDFPKSAQSAGYRYKFVPEHTAYILTSKP